MLNINWDIKEIELKQFIVNKNLPWQLNKSNRLINEIKTCKHVTWLSSCAIVSSKQISSSKGWKLIEKT